MRKRRLDPVLFPAEPREFAGRRAVKILLRASHVLSAGVLTGAYLFDVAEGRREAWLAATLITGGLILLLDLWESGVFLLQLRGLVVLVKVALLACLAWFEPWRGELLAVLVLVSVVSSHAPSRVRYLLIAGRGRLRGSETKG